MLDKINQVEENLEKVRDFNNSLYLLAIALKDDNQLIVSDMFFYRVRKVKEQIQIVADMLETMKNQYK